MNMTKKTAIELLVNQKVELIGYKPNDEFCDGDYDDLRACFILSITGGEYFPSMLADIYDITIRSEPWDDDGVKARKSLIGFMDAKHGQGFTFSKN